jgi:type IV pilus assembly protein PilA
MPESNDPLAGTKPLADPLRIITLFMLGGGILVAVLLSAIYMPQIGVFGFLLALAPASVAVSFALLVGRAGKPNAIYLRAFRTDRSTAQLRAQISAALGPGYCLSGIRPPREKTSVFLRFLMPSLVAFRYAGSKFMQLEAGDDWMARLWRTYQRTRVVFIDVREMTSHVHEEIQMTLQTMGLERVIFVVGPGRSGDQWRQTIGEVAGPEADLSQARVLDASPERIASWQVAADLKAMVSTLPAGVPGETTRGREFVLGHVTPDQLAASRRSSPTVVISAVVALALSFSVGVLPPQIRLVYYILAIAVSALVVAVAILRAMGRIRRLARAGHRGAAARSAFMLMLAIIPFLIGIVLPLVAIPALQKSEQTAHEVSAIASLRTLETAEIEYSTMYPDGFACQLSELGGNPATGAPTADAAQLIQEDLASGARAGYRFSLSCRLATVKGKSTVTGFNITAVPVDPGKTGHRGFCMDESGETRIDRNGGTNCTEALE